MEIGGEYSPCAMDNQLLKQSKSLSNPNERNRANDNKQNEQERPCTKTLISPALVPSSPPYITNFYVLLPSC